MATDLGGLRLFIGLVSFEKAADPYAVLAPEDLGAVGWMGGRAQNEEQFKELVRAELGELGLKFTEIEDVEEIDHFEDAAEFDEHLVHNMERWEPGKMTVWGTLFAYVAEGEA